MRMNRRRNTLLTSIIAVIAMAVFGVEEFVLKGDRLMRETVRADGNEAVSIDVTQVGVTHTVSVRPFSRKRALRIALTAPDGDEVYSRSEVTAHKGTRMFNFVPEAEGTYRLRVDRGALSGGSFSCTVDVFLNDRRIFRQLTSRFRL